VTIQRQKAESFGQRTEQPGNRSFAMAVYAGGRILVVEDDDGMREAIEALLGAASIESASYGSAEALLAGGAVEAAACVISDLKLPGMSGFELLAALRARGPAPPVIMITAHDAPGVRREAERLGAAAYLAKPFAGNALLAAIESVTTRRSDS
jgi:FixJ family two-component response regulator